MTTAFNRFAVGSFECTSLSDGENDYRLAQMFANVPEEEVRRLLRTKHLQEDLIVTPYTYLHVDTGDRQLLIDAGAGKLSKTTGLLLESMAAAELDPASVDLVIITHAHPDHIGGLLAEDGTPCFPNAEYIIWKREWDFWFSEVERERVGSGIPGFFYDLARSRLEAVRESTRRIELDEERSELAAGVYVRPAPGHTPGHLVVELSSGGENLLYTSDVVLTPIHLERPSWLPVFDILPAEASQTKKRIFDYAAKSEAWVLGQHFWPFPSLGHVARRDGAWEWQPATV